MSLVDGVDVGGGVPPGDAADAAVLAECRRAELSARRVEGELITALVAVEAGRVYLNRPGIRGGFNSWKRGWSHGFTGQADHASVHG